MTSIPPSKLKNGLKAIKEDLEGKENDEDLAYRERLKRYNESLNRLEGARILGLSDREIMTTKAFLTYNQMRLADSSFFDEVEEGNIIEIVGLDHQHLFCSPQFFDLSSYDVETLMRVPWEKLFRRDMQNIEDLMSFVNLVIESGKGKVRAPASRHLVVECYPEDRLAFDYQLKWFGCVLDEKQDRVVAYATIVAAKCVGEAAKFQILHK